MGQGEPSVRPRAGEWARTAVRRAGHLLATSPGGVSVWTALHAVDPTGASHPDRARERPFVVSGPAWSAAEPDLLADEESMHLTHLVDAHQPALAMLRWALEPELRRRAGRLAPARLDRHGLELWAATPEGWERARLPFELPLASPHQLPGAIQLLLSRAQTYCRERLALRPAAD
jgi:hypothetical protein